MSSSSSRAVLFVDDEPLVLRGFRDALRKEPYDILTAGSGLLALEALSRNRVDIVISDERMPAMSGGELLARVARDYPRIVRIMLTGEASLEESFRAIQGGIHRFLTKPIEPAELRRVISVALLMSQRVLGEAPSSLDPAAPSTRPRAPRRWAARGLG